MENVAYERGGLSWRDSLLVFYYISSSEIWPLVEVAL
jgi:hypothetical protein